MWFRRHRLALVAGVAALLGVVLLVGSVVAQTPTPTPGGPRFNYADAFLTHLAQNLGVDKTRLGEQIKAAARATVDDATQQGALTAEQAQRLKQRIDQSTPEQLVGKSLLGGPKRGHHHGPAKIGRLDGGLMQAAAQRLNLTPEQLRTELASGKSLTQIAQERGVSRDDLKAALVQAARAQVDQARQQGRLTQEQADRLLANVESRIDHLIDAVPRHRRMPKTPTPSGSAT